MQIDKREKNQPIKDLLALLLLHCDAVLFLLLLDKRDETSLIVCCQPDETCQPVAHQFLKDALHIFNEFMFSLRSADGV